MGILGFARKHILPALLGGAGALIAAWGFLGDAQSLWTAGVRPGYLQLSGFVLFVVATVSVVYRQHQEMEARFSGLPATIAGASVAAAAARPGPRTLDAAQVKMISTSESPAPAKPLTISYVDVGDGYAFATDLAEAFRKSIGWKVQHLEVIDPLRDAPDCGLMVAGTDRNALQEHELFLVRALRRANIEHEVRGLGENWGGQGWLIVSSRRL